MRVRIAFIATLSLMLLAGGWAGRAHAVTCGQTISGTVDLDQNLYCPNGVGLNIASGAVLNGKGFSIKGPGCGKGFACVGGICTTGPFAALPNPLNKCGASPGPSQIGLNFNGSDGATVTDVKVRGFYHGVSMKTAANGNILTGVLAEGNGVTTCPNGLSQCGYGVEVVDSDNNDFVGITVTDNADEGVHISGGSTNNELTNRPIEGCFPVNSVVKCNGRENIYILNSNSNIVHHTTTNYASCKITPQNGRKASVYLDESDSNTIEGGNTFQDGRVFVVAGSNNNSLGATYQLGFACVKFVAHCTGGSNNSGDCNGAADCPGGTCSIPTGNNIKGNLYCTDEVNEDHVAVQYAGPDVLPKNKVCGSANCYECGDPFDPETCTEETCEVENTNIVQVGGTCP